MGQGWSNQGTATAMSAEGGDVSRKAETGSPAAAVPEGMAKCKKKKNKKKEQEVGSVKENGTVEQEAASVAAAAKDEEVDRKVDTESAATAVPEGMAKCKKNKNKKRKQEVPDAKENGTVEQKAASVLAAAEGEMVNGKVEMESTATAVPERTAKCIKGKRRKRGQEVANAKENRTVQQEAASATSAVLASEGMPKSKKELKAKERMMTGREASATALSTLDETPKCEEEGKAKERGVVEEGTSNSAVSEPEGTIKCKRKKLKKKMQEQQEPAESLAGLVAVDKIAASKPGNGGTNVEGVSGDAEVNMDLINAEDPNCLEAKDANVNDRKGKEREIMEQGTTTSAVSVLAPERTRKHKRKKLRTNMQEQQEPAEALSGLVVVDEIVASKPVIGGTIWEGESSDADVSMGPIVAEDQNCSKAKDDNNDKAKERDIVEQGTTTSAVSAMEGTPNCKNEKEKERGIAEQEATTGTISEPQGTARRKRKRLKKKMQEQPKPAEALSGFVAVDNIASSRHVTGGTNGEGASGDADVTMNPINVEEPNCSKAMDANDNDKKAKKRKIVEQGTTTSGVSVDEHNEKIRNVYSPRGSLIRFQRKKLLILDLNGLLADINMDHQNAHMAHAKVKGKLVFKRPYYDDFLRFCFQNFELGIWSSRKMENVCSVVDILMRDLKQHLLFCWDMSKCTFTGHKVIGDKHKPLVLKELKHLWNKADPNLPWEQGEFSPSNTLLVDDSPYKALCNPPHTAIFPQPYSYLNQKDDFSLGPGGDLRVYLERLAAADDVQVFVRDNPFGQPSITDSDPKWNFYSKIVNKVERGLSLKQNF